MIGMTSRVSFVLCLGFLTAVPPVWSQPVNPEDTQDEAAFLVEALGHPEARIRQTAVRKLGELDDKPYDALVSVLAKGTRFQAACAAVALRNLKTGADPIPADTQAALYEILSNPRTEVWRWNITTLLIAGRPQTSEIYDEAATTKDRGIAEESLKDHVDLWIRGVNHPDPQMQLPSLWALQKIQAHGKPAEQAVAGLLHRPRRPLTSFVLNQEIVADGILGLETPIPQYDPLTILETLVAIQADPRLMADPLMSLTRHSSEYVRLDAATMLGKLDPANLPTDPRPHAARVLADLVVLPWGKVRESAVRELGNLGEVAVGQLPVLIGLLEDPHGAIRVQAAVSLGKMGAVAEPALPALKRALRFAELDTQDAAETLQAAIEAIEEAIRENMVREKPNASKMI